ncbi:acetylxylan esterase [Pedobacter mucosus]|uniref:acetylxylan esterase n=1 Tax=Pedobacter mucosus TaxID=2895286 RepID=UPI001EE42A99|nr:acetylxylan esterase [Pedobacter mucosus]UKT65423.1 acetylxylan esterase [Pedobacter mucosus]
MTCLKHWTNPFSSLHDTKQSKSEIRLPQLAQSQLRNDDSTMKGDQKSSFGITVKQSSLRGTKQSHASSVHFCTIKSTFFRNRISTYFILVILVCFSSFTNLSAQTQNTDNLYKKPLVEVLKDIQTRYKITVKYSEPQVKDKFVNYANWRFRADVDETLANVLTPLDMKVNKEKPGVYKLKEYEYYRWEVQDGWAYLDSLATKYHDKTTWEKRKSEIKPELFKALLLSPLPAKPNSKPIITAKRIYDGYSVENIALEILPGIWINGSLYQPLVVKGKIPVVLSPDGHWEKQRFRPDCQIRCAMIAKMGAMAFSYDLFAWGESMLQFKYEDHRKSLAQTVQTLGGIRILDYFTSLKNVDTNRVGISGGSGAGSHSILMTAMDARIKLSAPVVAMSSYFYGGCPCESGMPIHQCAGGTDNVELAAMAAPMPQLIVSDGSDWTAHTPEHDFPYLQKMYGYYGVTNKVENVHLPDEKHDFGVNKRIALYDFLIKYFKLNGASVKDKSGKYNESKVTIEKENALFVFGDKGEKLPKNAVIGFENLEKLFPYQTSK